jgi:heptaprenyl diphosphate synthase
MTDGWSKSIDLDALPAVRELMVQTLRRSDQSLNDVMIHLTQENGKNFRARLLLAAAADPQGQVPDEAIVTAAAMEILHLATLVHDDIIDDAPTRRGQPSIQSRFGKKTAVLGGDYLFCICFSMIAAISVRYPGKFKDFAQAMTRICVGELRQNQHIGDTELGMISYLRTIGGKTAAMFALAMYAGGILGGSPEPEARQLAHIGLDIGMLFQLADDCLDYEATAATIRKSVKHDLREGVITLPLILAFAAEPALKDLVRDRILTTADIEAISSAVVRHGGVAGTWQVARRYALRAQRRIDRLNDPDRRSRLTGILNQIQTRNS